MDSHSKCAHKGAKEPLDVGGGLDKKDSYTEYRCLLCGKIIRVYGYGFYKRTVELD